jgi:hypothetical protein
MKKINLLLLLLSFSSISFAQNARLHKGVQVSKVNRASMMTLQENSMVPEKTNITVVDANGRMVRRFSGGSRVGGLGILDCVKQKCPNTFDTTVVCWECQQRKIQ